MSNDIQAPENASPEILDILKEIDAEGKEPEAKPAEVAKTEEQKPEAKAEDAAPKEGQEAEKPKPAERTSKYVPVAKHNEERHKRQDAETRAEAAERRAAEAEARLAAASNKPGTETNDDLANLGKSLAEKHDLEPGFVTDLLEGVSKLTAKQQKDLPPELKADLEEFKAAKAEVMAQKQAIAEEQHFDAELASVIKEFPELASAREALKELAFSDDHKTTPLRTLALAYQYEHAEKPGRKTMETATGSRNNTEVIDYKEMTDEKLEKLDGPAQDKYFEWLRKNRKG